MIQYLAVIQKPILSFYDDDKDNDVYFTLATSDSRIGKYKTVGEQLTDKNRSIYSAIWIIERDYVGMVE